ncbi:unnamed protein product [Nesidiocoris tenuis]|uniref:RNA-directed DNA polymerase n=1 Tax=Nesidiocoris tenuis TaxID=355587 RepID=A0A6H5HI94_9HEMI|nr:unnamed protein product [Nesidiocoris tenuis]
MVLLVLIIGMKDGNISDKLQLDPDLTLTKAITTLRQHEGLIRQKEDLRDQNVSELRKRQFPVKVTSKNASSKNFAQQNRRELAPHREANQKICQKCGYEWHDRMSNCPARKARCKNCFRIGHYSKMCLSKNKNVRDVECSQSDDETDSYVHSVTSKVSRADLHIGCTEQQKSCSAWTQKLKVTCGNELSKFITFKLDTAADVTMIPATQFQNSLSELPLQTSTSNVFSAKRKDRFHILGTLKLVIGHKDIEIVETAYISEDIDIPLLGRAACERLHLVQRIFHVNVDNWYSEFPTLFKGLGSMKGEYIIEMKDNAKPYAISSPRAIPIALKDKVKEALDDMIEKGVIVRVDHATDWCAPMVVSIKKGGGIRICVDLSQLNRSVKRQYHPIPKIELSLAEVNGAKYFSKLDANHGFWQLNLAKESQDYTTFITPFGRFKFRKLPFGITSAPEEYQKRISMILEGSKNCLSHLDDILIWGNSKEEHDQCLREVLEKLQAAGVTLNKKKTAFCKESVTYLGFLLSRDGIQADPGKVKAIQEMETPSNTKEAQRLMGMATFLAKFIPNKSELLEPISSLTSSKNAFVWGPAQDAAFRNLKKSLTTPPCLAMFDPSKPTMVSSDASTLGLGAVLFQGNKGDQKPVAYISRTLSAAEKNYANIEREALALTWACDRLKYFLIGKPFVIETDHKPLVQIFTTKNLDDLSPRLQRFRMRMMRYDYIVQYTPGKNLLIADTLSRKPIQSGEDGELEEEVDAFIHEVCLANVHTSDENLVRVADAQMRDPVCTQLKLLIKDEWPPLAKLPVELRPYYPIREELSVIEGILLRGTRMLIPAELRPVMLEKLHTGHQGITKTRRRAQRTMWWPNISNEIEQKIKSCPVCIQNSVNRAEPLIPSPIPAHAWQRASLDLFKLESDWYLVITDHFSRYFQVAKMKRMRASDIIKECKSTFSLFGVPEEVFSDSGTQFNTLETSEFQQFAREWGFKTYCSSPQYHQANGAAEAAVKTAKSLLKKNTGDFELALLAYRNTPLANGFSPAELLFGRRLRDNLPSTPTSRQERPDSETIFKQEEKYRSSYKKNFDSRHRAKELEPLKCRDPVWVTDLKRHGHINKVLDAPRSYLVDTDKSIVRRNRLHLIPAPYMRRSSVAPVGNGTPPKQQADASAMDSRPSPGPAMRTRQKCRMQPAPLED